MTVLVDTSALYALLDEDDDNHPRAKAIWPDLVGGADLVTQAYAVVETSALVQRRLGMRAVGALHDGLLQVVDTIPVDLATHRLAVDRWRGSGDRDLSLVDATSFVVMTEAGIAEAFAFDDDFAEAGFRLVE